ncbi:MAG: YjbF family lipoprotein [Alphaproteobacteria bacterium]|nr:YjbF family lipoprotein [Alphaproteobacteria bacterium]
MTLPRRLIRAPQRLFSVLITCEDRDAGPETISILGKDIHTRRIDESCRSDDSLDWSFRNVFWVDPETGLVWRSIQHVNPKLDAVEIDVLRPPG